MKLADLELSAYDFAAIILPGSIGVAEFCVAIYGLEPFLKWIMQISLGNAVTALLLSFAVGQLVSQASFELATALGGKRVLRRGRDRYWKKNHLLIRGKLRANYLIEIETDDSAACDRAHNHCLTVIGDGFAKRKVFTFVSSLSLALWFLGITAAPTALRVYWRANGGWRAHADGIAMTGLAILFVAWLAWRRSQLYADLADVTTFDVFEAICVEKKGKEETIGRPKESVSEDD